MEYCEGGSLLDRMNDLIRKDLAFTTDQAAEITRQIVSGLHYAHSNKIVHRDIKLENVLFVSNDPMDLRIKIIDFGLSKYFEKGMRRMNEKQGTCYYMAPEVLKGFYSEKCDLWSVGCLLYILLIGVPPFFSDTDGDDKQIYEKVSKVDFSFKNNCKENDQMKKEK